MTDDTAAVRTVLADYFLRLDLRQFTAAAGCFEVNAQATYGGITLDPGREAVRSYLERALSPTISTRHLATGFDISSVDTDSADSVTTALAYVVRTAGDGPELQVRGLTYHDRLRRTGATWLITHRVHTVGWVSIAPVAIPDPGADALVRTGTGHF